MTPDAFSCDSESGGLGFEAQDEEAGGGDGCDGPGGAVVVGELDEHGVVVELLDDGADLPAGEPFLGQVVQQRHHVEEVHSLTHRGSIPCSSAGRRT